VAEKLSLYELLLLFTKHKKDQQFVKVSKEGEGLDAEEKILDINFQPLSYMNREAYLVTIRDIT